MTETQPDPQIVRVYPKGWNQGYIVAGDEADGTARVPWTNHRRDCEWAAREAEKFTGTPMEVFSDLDEGDPCWSYRPAFRKPLTVADIPAGQGPASLCVDEYGVVRYRATGGRNVVVPAGWVPRDADEVDALNASLTRLAATVPHVTREDAP